MILHLTYDTMISITDYIIDNEDGNTCSCDSCDKAAEIFQVEGDYCLDCWKKRTYPNP